MGFWYFVRNVFKPIGLLIAMTILNALTLADSEEISGNIGLVVFLFILFFATVSTTYDLGGGWFLKVTTGCGLGAAAVGFFIVTAFSYAFLNWVTENTSLVAGILLASYALNQVIETFKYSGYLPKFFTVTGFGCAAVFAIEMFCAFTEKPPFVFSMSYEGLGGMLQILLMFATVLFTFINIIARATQAWEVED